MFIEPSLTGGRRGWIEVICGSMFSGKTEELIRRLKRARIANLSVEIFKPAIDVRYDHEHIVSHNDVRIPSTPVESSQQILLMGQGVDVVGIDEAQFFDMELPNVCDQLALRGSVSSWPASIWTSAASHSALSLPCLRRRTTSPNYMPFVSAAVTLRHIPTELPPVHRPFC